jgi:hypothetical protein
MFSALHKFLNAMVIKLKRLPQILFSTCSFRISVSVLGASFIRLSPSVSIQTVGQTFLDYDAGNFH